MDRISRRRAAPRAGRRARARRCSSRPGQAARRPHRGDPRARSRAPCAKTATLGCARHLPTAAASCACCAARPASASSPASARRATNPRCRGRARRHAGRGAAAARRSRCRSAVLSCQGDHLPEVRVARDQSAQIERTRRDRGSSVWIRIVPPKRSTRSGRPGGPARGARLLHHLRRHRPVRQVDAGRASLRVACAPAVCRSATRACRAARCASPAARRPARSSASCCCTAPTTSPPGPRRCSTPPPGPSSSPTSCARRWPPADRDARPLHRLVAGLPGPRPRPGHRRACSSSTSGRPAACCPTSPSSSTSTPVGRPAGDGGPPDRIEAEGRVLQRARGRGLRRARAALPRARARGRRRAAGRRGRGRRADAALGAVLRRRAAGRRPMFDSTSPARSTPRRTSPARCARGLEPRLPAGRPRALGKRRVRARAGRAPSWPRCGGCGHCDECARARAAACIPTSPSIEREGEFIRIDQIDELVAELSLKPFVGDAPRLDHPRGREAQRRGRQQAAQEPRGAARARLLPARQRRARARAADDRLALSDGRVPAASPTTRSTRTWSAPRAALGDERGRRHRPPRARLGRTRPAPGRRRRAARSAASATCGSPPRIVPPSATPSGRSSTRSARRGGRGGRGSTPTSRDGARELERTVADERERAWHARRLDAQPGASRRASRASRRSTRSTI